MPDLVPTESGETNQDNGQPKGEIPPCRPDVDEDLQARLAQAFGLPFPCWAPRPP